MLLDGYVLSFFYPGPLFRPSAMYAILSLTVLDRGGGYGEYGGAGHGILGASGAEGARAYAGGEMDTAFNSRFK